MFIGNDANLAYVFNYEATPLVFATSATERMRINSGGNVNLLNATSTDSKHFGITNAAGTTGWTFGNGVIANSHQFVIYDNTAGSSRILINSSGNVGIGTDSPTNGKFVINQNSSAASFGGNVCQLFENFNTTDGQMMSIGFRNNNSVGTTAYIDAVAYDQSIGATDIRFSTYSGSAWSSNMVTFQHTGRVGIGTTSPQSKLDLLQPDSSANTLGQSVTAALGIRMANAVGQVGQIVFNNDAAPSYGYGSIGMIMTSGTGVGLGDMIFATKGTGSDSASTERMRIDSNGAVGIGANNVSYRLRIKSDATVDNGIYLSAGTNFTNHSLYVENRDATAEFFAVRGDGEIRFNASSGHTYAAQGIRFGANATANNLNYYEEGTWTPVIAHNDGTGVVPITVNAARYLRVGQLVYVSAYLTGINPNGNAGGSGPYYGIRGFPFQPENYGAWQIVYASSGITAYGGYSGGASLYFMANGTNGQRSQAHLNGAGVNAWGSSLTLMMNCVYNIHG